MAEPGNPMLSDGKGKRIILKFAGLLWIITFCRVGIDAPEGTPFSFSD
jgi:hypothetical protein